MSSMFCSQKSISIYSILNGDKEPDPNIPLLRYYYAYHGNLSLYLKVYNKDNIDDKESLCIIEGCHQNFDFARWCYSNIPSTNQKIHQAISESFIINDDLSYIHDDIYYIWYPHSPSEQTLRQLYQMKPKLKYLIARACVVGDYTDFYKELDVLPEIHVIVEIMSRLRFKFLKYVNIETIYVCMEDKYCIVYDGGILYDRCAMNICHDILVNNNIDIFHYIDNITLNDDDICCSECCLSGISISKLNSKILAYKTLPTLSQESISIYKMIKGIDEPKQDIPVLKYYYAYYGDLEMYKKVVNVNDINEKESMCLVNGCYFNSQFARWCRFNIPTTNQRVHRAISESYIMNNDLSYVRDDINCVSHNSSPDRDTLRKLLKLKPSLKQIIADACFASNYKELYESIGMIPSPQIITKRLLKLNTDCLKYITEDFAFDETYTISKHCKEYDFSMETISEDDIIFTGQKIDMSILNTKMKIVMWFHNINK